MTEEDLRRNLQIAFDPGPDFPSRTLVSRTVALLPKEIGARPRGATLPRLRWILPLVATLLVIATVATLVLAGRLLSQRAIPVSPPIPAPPSGSGFRYVGTDVPYMVSESTGWTVDYPISLMRTIDGGAHWSSVPGQQTMFTGLLTPLSWRDYAIDATHAWIVVSQGDDTTFVFRTADAGRSWSRGESIPTPRQVGELFFLDPENGWVLTYSVQTTAGDFMTTGPVVIFRTTDGGMHWRRLSENVFPISGCEWDGISFASTSTGWMGVACSGPQKVSMLFVTHDGGDTWQPQSQPISTWVCRPRVPSFTDSANGTAVVCNPDGQHVLLETSDGGSTWDVRQLPFVQFGFTPPSDTQPGVRGPFPEQVGFTDAVHGWALLCTSNDVRFYRTDDGGMTWHDLSTGLTTHVGASCVGVSFLNASVGLVWELNNAQETLFKTTDGGVTWTLTSSRHWIPHFP